MLLWHGSLVTLAIVEIVFLRPRLVFAMFDLTLVLSADWAIYVFINFCYSRHFYHLGDIIAYCERGICTPRRSKCYAKEEAL